jgi:hypothetical protein
MTKVTPAQLQRAHQAAHLRGTLADAQRWPTLARCLEITAAVIAHPKAGELRPPQAAPPTPPPSDQGQGQQDFFSARRRDFKRACAADHDE